MNEHEDNYQRTEEDQIFNSPQKWFVREKWSEYATIRKDSNRRSFIRYLTLTSTKTYDVDFLNH